MTTTVIKVNKLRLEENNMTISYNMTGEDRKRLVQALGEVLQEKPVYMRAPTYGYTVGVCTVDKNGIPS